MDKDGYPSDHELAMISAWDYKNMTGWFDFIESLWWNSGWGVVREKRKVYLATGGWSGNEDIIHAMRQNIMLWGRTWRWSKAGGGYKFKIPKIPKEYL